MSEFQVGDVVALNGAYMAGGVHHPRLELRIGSATGTIVSLSTWGDSSERAQVAWDIQLRANEGKDWTINTTSLRHVLNEHEVEEAIQSIQDSATRSVTRHA